ncbi:MAG: protein-tyrosine phosphatase family protein [Candidatus Binatia bacterium]
MPIRRIEGERNMPTCTWWIDEPLVKGSSNPSDNELAGFRADGFTSGVSLLNESKQPPRYDKHSAETKGWSIYSIPIKEGRAPSLEQIRDFVACISKLAKRSKVLVFCQSGKGRTACMGAAYWIAKGLTASQAVVRVSRACSARDWATPERRRVLTEYERLDTSKK